MEVGYGDFKWKSRSMLYQNFLKRYDYDAVLEILEEAGIIDGDLYFLIESCQYSVNFELKEL